MHRAKHRAAGRASADVLATTLIERFAVDALAESPHHAVAVPAPRSAVALADRPDSPIELPDEGDFGDTGLFGIALYGGGTPTGPMLAVTDEVPVREAAPLFRDTAGDDDLSRCVNYAGAIFRKRARQGDRGEKLEAATWPDASPLEAHTPCSRANG